MALLTSRNGRELLGLKSSNHTKQWPSDHFVGKSRGNATGLDLIVGNVVPIWRRLIVRHSGVSSSNAQLMCPVPKTGHRVKSDSV